jgi:hypothetical protein
MPPMATAHPALLPRALPRLRRAGGVQKRAVHHAVCGYCQSTVVRSGEVLTRLGKMAELFDDHSPLQLMASGRISSMARSSPSP